MSLTKVNLKPIFVEIIEIWKEMTEMNTISAYLTDWSTP